MSKTGVCLIIAACLILIGGIVFTFAMTQSGWNFSTRKYETRTVKIDEAFNSILIETNTEDIVFVPSQDGTCSIVFHEWEKEQHTTSIQDGTLSIGVTDLSGLTDHFFSSGFEKSKVTLYLPRTEYEALSIREDTGDVMIPKDFVFGNIDIAAHTGEIGCDASAHETIKIKTSTGDINVGSISAKELSLSVSTGKVSVSSAALEGDLAVSVSTGRSELTNVVCANFTSTGDTGRVIMTNVICSEKLSVKRTTGDVTLSECDAAELEIVTSTGDVEGTLLSEKVFIIKTDTGKTEVPETITGGKCKITTSTGNIKISIR